MDSASVVLLSNASTTSAAKPWPGGRGFFAMNGTFGGTSAQLQYMGPSGTYISVSAMDATGVFTAVPLTADGGFVFDLPATSIKVVLTAGAPSAMYATAARIPE